MLNNATNTGHGSRRGSVLQLGWGEGRRRRRNEKSTYIIEFDWELLVFCNMLLHLWPLRRGRGVLAQAVGIVQQFGGIEGGYRPSSFVDPPCSWPLPLQHCLTDAIQTVNHHAVLHKCRNRGSGHLNACISDILITIHKIIVLLDTKWLEGLGIDRGDNRWHGLWAGIKKMHLLSFTFSSHFLWLPSCILI